MEKKTILLACAAGMSTSLLVSKMQKAAEEQGRCSSFRAAGKIYGGGF